ncbi:MAG: hypothetical protein AB7Q29_00175 [Vicinamibacterales bacterium]
MVIKASSGRQVHALLGDLSSSDDVAREAAVARLIVIGPRAVQRLTALATDGDAGDRARVAALHALEGIGDSRSCGALLGLLAVSAPPAVVAAAVGALRALLSSPRGVQVLDALTAAAVDRSRDRAVRLAAIRAVRDLEPSTVEPLLRALSADPDPAIVRAAGVGRAEAAVDPAQRLKDAASGNLPDRTEPLQAALAEAGGDAPIPVLHKLVETIRFREGVESGAARAEWTAVRGSAHALLARRGSRVALYDLRETLASAREPLPVEFLSAAAAAADASCLEPLASAYARAAESGRPPDDWWRRRLLEIFQTVAAREQVTRRHAAGRRITGKWPNVAAMLWS